MRLEISFTFLFLTHLSLSFLVRFVSFAFLLLVDVSPSVFSSGLLQQVCRPPWGGGVERDPTPPCPSSPQPQSCRHLPGLMRKSPVPCRPPQCRRRLRGCRRKCFVTKIYQLERRHRGCEDRLRSGKGQQAAAC